MSDYFLREDEVRAQLLPNTDRPRRALKKAAKKAKGN